MPGKVRRAMCCIKLRQMLSIRENIAYIYHEFIRCVGEPCNLVSLLMENFFLVQHSREISTTEDMASKRFVAYDSLMRLQTCPF